ncbi:hypothetical protein EZBTHKR_2268 [Elizabethkingia anophelis]|nr:hypothetical protein EZBTHKR_2268 [Elizabethkingia anophelis]
MNYNYKNPKVFLAYINLLELIVVIDVAQSQEYILYNGIFNL